MDQAIRRYNIKASFIAFLLFFFSYCLQSQTVWDGRAKSFVKDAANNRYKLSAKELKGAIDTSTAMINTFCKTCNQEVLSSVYLARANLQIFLIEYEADQADGYTAPPATLSRIKSDLLKAQTSCESCKCGILDNVLSFYQSYGSPKQLDSLAQVAKDLGKPADHGYLGLGLNFMPPKGIFGIELGYVMTSSVAQPKRWISPTSGNAFRKCKYEYPIAVGVCFIGYETSIMDKSYHAFKFDPIWLNYGFSVHPIQLLMANGPDGNTFIYRPELGVSFSTLAVNFAVNIPLNNSYSFLSAYNVSLRFTIPTIKFN